MNSQGKGDFASSDGRVSLAHGNGGRRMRQLIEELFVRHLGNALLDTDADAAALPPLPTGATPMITTDGFTVDPLEFPGGNIGSLAVHGTVNDLAVSGAEPLYLTLNCFLEEGLDLGLLDRLTASMAAAATEAGVKVVAGDTKVVRRGEGGGVYLATSGVGLRRAGLDLGLGRIAAGDHILVSGPVGDHGTAVLLARGQFGLRGDLVSDSASVLPVTRALVDVPGLRFMRDPTRGGLATVAHEIVRHTGMGIRLSEPAIPIRDQVRAVCEMLGYNPLYLASEGRVVAVVDPASAPAALAAMRGPGQSPDAVEIGTVGCEEPYVVLETEIGGERLIEELEADPLPRIC
ncbi:hydrogenase expression/formation protein HypE [Bradyrhizobium sp. BTAi1]|uniref:hydrogenase expression/formation protein HypE n=1 Tax=Bradyrhizobium sp. (strain BTAi1 / ATCC BAA-1182) TaxID=288000 RepID=UPI00005DE186|nr:hydrogenase expression/formation protein HypE [Bradyrhizobium sp. BTAi1]ABQ39831.1 Hydrogenase expression/formation protein [Bradyrhizobium sp. BTAi1]